MTALPFELPARCAGEPRPVWDGLGFRIGGERSRVVAYGVGSSGWTDDLTSLHEDETASGTHFIDVASRRRAVASLERHGFPADGTLLEVGVSGGHLLRDLRERFPAAGLIGSDYTLGTLDRLAPDMPGIPLIRFDLTRSPLPEASADAIVLLNVLEHIGDDETAVAECFRMLRPGGLIVVEVPAGPALFDDYDRELMHFRRYTGRELDRKLAGAGFTIIERSCLGFALYPAFWLSKKLNRLRTTPTRGGASPRKPADAGRVRSAIRSTYRLNALGNRLMAAEAWLGSRLPLPFGIRCVAVGRKP